MYCLFLDHSFSQEVLGLFYNDTVLHFECVEQKDQGDSHLFFQKILHNHHLKLEQIAYLCCGQGPGSYTGMRSAASTMLTLGFALQKPVVFVSSLLLLSPEQDGTYLLLKDARYAGFYGQEIEIEKGHLVKVLEPSIFDRKIFPESVQIVGYEGERQKLPEGTIFSALSPQKVAVCAYTQYHPSLRYDETYHPLFYMRKTQAEIEEESSVRKLR